MTIRVTTRHSEDFDIFTEMLDPDKSPYATMKGNYAAKVRAFYEKLGVRWAMWATPEEQPPKHLETCKPVEYLMEIDESRVLAYVDEDTWSDYLYGKRQDFNYSRTPQRYPTTSILIATPVTKNEVKAIRRYRRTNGPDHYELVEERAFKPGES